MTIKKTQSKEISQFLNNEGIGVTMDVVENKSSDNSVREKMIERADSYVQSNLQEIASRHGKIVMPLTQEKLRSGPTLFAIGVEDTENKSFGLLFALVSSNGDFAQIVFEGIGTVESHRQEFKRLVEAANWEK